MKLAVIFEKDAASSEKTAESLKLFGYVTASVKSASEAFNVLSAINADVIVIYSASSPEERRSIPNELKRIGPETAVILITDSEEEYLQARVQGFPGVDAVIKRPASVEAFRRVLETELDPCFRTARIVPERERRQR
jgi:DNA-binding NtrC family response regulator